MDFVSYGLELIFVLISGCKLSLKFSLRSGYDTEKVVIYQDHLVMDVSVL
jgi:hypothetical protein